MKNKDLKKIATIITDEIRNYNSPIAEKVEDTWCEYDSEVSSKFKKMILSLSNYKNNLRFDVSDSRTFLVLPFYEELLMKKTI